MTRAVCCACRSSRPVSSRLRPPPRSAPRSPRSTSGIPPISSRAMTPGRRPRTMWRSASRSWRNSRGRSAPRPTSCTRRSPRCPGSTRICSGWRSTPACAATRTPRPVAHGDEPAARQLARPERQRHLVRAPGDPAVGADKVVVRGAGRAAAVRHLPRRHHALGPVTLSSAEETIFAKAGDLTGAGTIHNILSNAEIPWPRSRSRTARRRGSRRDTRCIAPRPTTASCGGAQDLFRRAAGVQRHVRRDPERRDAGARLRQDRTSSTAVSRRRLSRTMCRRRSTSSSLPTCTPTCRPCIDI